MASTAFTKNLVEAQKQWTYLPVSPCRFVPPPDFEQSVGKVIKRGNLIRQEAQTVYTLRCSKPSWTSAQQFSQHAGLTWRRLGVFPRKLEEAIINPLFKKGDQAKPESYCSVTLLPHKRKTIYYTIPTYLCGHLAGARSVRFPTGDLRRTGAPPSISTCTEWPKACRHPRLSEGL